jgi:hypothetical protein
VIARQPVDTLTCGYTHKPSGYESPGYAGQAYCWSGNGLWLSELPGKLLGLRRGILDCSGSSCCLVKAYVLPVLPGKFLECFSTTLGRLVIRIRLVLNPNRLLVRLPRL